MGQFHGSVSWVSFTGQFHGSVFWRATEAQKLAGLLARLLACRAMDCRIAEGDLERNCSLEELKCECVRLGLSPAHERPGGDEAVSETKDKK